MVDKRAFFGFGFKVFLTLIVGFVVAGVILSYLLDYSLGEPYYDALVVLNVARHSSMKFTLTFVALVHLVVLWVVFTMSLTMSNRISGPMYRLERVTESIGEGDLTVDVALRKNDYMTAQADCYRQTVAGIRDVLSEVRGDTARLDERLAEMRRLVDSGRAGPAEVERFARELRDIHAGLAERLSFFKT